MKGFVQDIEGIAIKNTEFRQVLYTAKNCQPVVMALEPKGESRHERLKRSSPSRHGTRSRALTK
jgi:hypothetical protein